MFIINIQDSIGTVQGCYPENWIYLGTSFAPGIWSGTEGLNIKINNKQYTVLAVDFNKKALKLNTTTDIIINSDIFTYSPFIIIDCR